MWMAKKYSKVVRAAFDHQETILRDILNLITGTGEIIEIT